MYRAGEVDVNSFLNETVPYEVQGLEAAMQYTVKSPRTWDDSMVRRFRKRPEFAVRMLNSCMEDGDQVAFLVTLSVLNNSGIRPSSCR